MSKKLPNKERRSVPAKHIASKLVQARSQTAYEYAHIHIRLRFQWVLDVVML